MSFLLDTDICSAHLKGVGVVTNRVQQYSGRLFVSAINLGELFTWSFRRRASPRRLIKLREFLNDVAVLDVTAEVAEEFGKLRAAMFDAGRSVHEMDALIAATALVHGLNCRDA